MTQSGSKKTSCNSSSKTYLNLCVFSHNVRTFKKLSFRRIDFKGIFFFGSLPNACQNHVLHNLKFDKISHIDISTSKLKVANHMNLIHIRISGTYYMIFSIKSIRMRPLDSCKTIGIKETELSFGYLLTTLN